METRLDPVNPEITAKLNIEIPMIPEDPEEIAVREGIHERYIMKTRREKLGAKRCQRYLRNGMKSQI